MEIKTKISFNGRSNLYSINAEDEATSSKIALGRAFESSEEAELAEAILKYMFSTYSAREEFNASEWDYNVKTVFRLLNTPNKW